MSAPVPPGPGHVLLEAEEGAVPGRALAVLAAAAASVALTEHARRYPEGLALSLVLGTCDHRSSYREGQPTRWDCGPAHTAASLLLAMLGPLDPQQAARVKSLLCAVAAPLVAAEVDDPHALAEVLDGLAQCADSWIDHAPGGVPFTPTTAADTALAVEVGRLLLSRHGWEMPPPLAGVPSPEAVALLDGLDGLDALGHWLAGPQHPAWQSGGLYSDWPDRLDDP